MTRWWRSHSVRVQLTLWYAAAMIVVLGLYAAAVFASVSRSMSDSLDQRLRSDFQWAAAMVDQRPDGTVTWLEPEGFGDEDRPWLQVWSRDGQLLYQSSEARQSAVAGQAASLAAQADNKIAVGADRHRAGPHAQQQRDDSLEGSRRHAGGHPGRAQRGADAPAAAAIWRSSSCSACRSAWRRPASAAIRSPGARWRRSSG